MARMLYFSTNRSFIALCLIFQVFFFYFAKKIQKVGLPFINDTFTHKKVDIVNSLECLKSKITGYVHLDIQKSKIKRRLSKAKYKDEIFYIIGGIFVSPFAKSILENNQVNSILLDTTFKVLPYYHTSILLASIKNTGVPLSFSFGSSEDKSLYMRHFDTFKKILNIDLTSYKFLSDQGTALIAVFNDLHIKHMACLRHLLVSLKISKYSYAIKNIISCSSKQELHNSLMFYSDLFCYDIDPSCIKKRNKLLKKVGLKFEKNLIMIEDDNLWEQISMVERVKLKMPSITNALESLHGHLNSLIPRRNIFWNDFYRLAQNFIIKSNYLDEQIRHNYNVVKKSTISHGFHLQNRILDEIKM